MPHPLCQTRENRLFAMMGYRTRHDFILGLERPCRDIHATNHQNLEYSELPRAGHRLGNERISPLYPKWNYQNIKETIAVLALLLLSPGGLRKQSIAAMLRRL